MTGERMIEKTYTKIKLEEQNTDFIFWQSQPPEKRLQTLEQIRSEYHAWKYDTQPRFQRILSVTKRK